jgi:GTP-binding protein EngB required for normal cell division
MTKDEREKRARLYDTYLRDYDKLAREVSVIKGKFDLTKEDQVKIDSLTKQMKTIMNEAQKLGDYHN